jgi:hypothetical protein
LIGTIWPVASTRTPWASAISWRVGGTSVRPRTCASCRRSTPGPSRCPTRASISSSPRTPPTCRGLAPAT